jgi:hypothetical protein
MVYFSFLSFDVSHSLCGALRGVDEDIAAPRLCMVDQVDQSKPDIYIDVEMVV